MARISARFGSGLACVLAVAALCGCSLRCPDIPGRPMDIREYSCLAQNASAFVLSCPERIVAPDRQDALAREFTARHFAPWHRTEPESGLADVRGIFSRPRGERLYGENGLERDPGWLEGLIQDCGLDSYPNDGRPAVTVAETAMRSLPDSRPAFYGFSRPGQGFPFDHLQHTAVHAGTPLFVSHLSRDRAWVLAECRFALGWIPARDVAFVDPEFMEAFESCGLLALTRDNAAMLDDQGSFLFTGRIGAVYPLLAADDSGFLVLAPARDHLGRAVLLRSRVEAGQGSPFPLEMRAENLALIIDRMLGQAYGWGGLYNDRDCSAGLMDLFAAFGLCLPRNSGEQARAGRREDLAGLSLAEKLAAVAARARPFATLLHKPGHIMLYLGLDRSGNPAVFHYAWGLKTRGPLGRSGRAIIGRAVITGLDPGRDLPDADPAAGLLKALDCMTFPADAADPGPRLTKQTQEQ
ncbi:MAG: SH3 domain-containing protein [Desulfovibrionaceae bacterium]|nr:SH3 domain-containing protein [Desulfovibrionaceae bacterium]